MLWGRRANREWGGGGGGGQERAPIKIRRPRIRGGAPENKGRSVRQSVEKDFGADLTGGFFYLYIPRQKGGRELLVKPAPPSTFGVISVISRRSRRRFLRTAHLSLSMQLGMDEG